ncbi:MAG: carboxymuconolactone decarboxylase family protein [Gammaproteobacteria bacterium]|jgi:4-carboxymuconolactone decarboxylase|nr:carboxymuconolactone decarboxylase family protein [Gammaproteobacteria bacterium]MBT5051764.1 carboxymuconolactone decarboxylase family protein [Gammaproteobacteria bacterium]
MDNRYTSLDFEQLTPEQQQLHHQIATSRKLDPAQRLGGPFDPWIESPVLGEILSNLGYFHRFQSSLNRRQIELAILVTAAHWQAAFEWWAHEPMARNAGLTDSIITAIKHRQPPHLGDPLDQITWEIAGALQHDQRLSTELYQRAVAGLGRPGLIELISLCGYYTTVAMTLNALEIPLPMGEAQPFRASAKTS